MGFTQKYRLSSRPLSLWLISLALLASSSIELIGQDNLRNSADLYRSYAPVKCKYYSVLAGDSVQIYARLDFADPPSDSLSIDFAQIDQGDEESNHELYLREALSTEEGRYVFKWVYPKNEAPLSLALRVFIHPRAWVFRHVPLVFSHHPSGNISHSVNHQPQFDSYLQASDSVRLEHAVDSILFAYYYNHDFLPARPPMTLKAQQRGNALKIDTVMALVTDQLITFPKPGLYFIQADTNGIEGISLLVTPHHYPKAARIDELSAPLIYLTTKDEYENLKEDLTSKKALDRFWLSTIGDPQKARKSIKRFYKLMAEANELFSSYKEGWKTDRGMIYMVMGPPDVVQFEGQKEIWRYGQNNGFTIQYSFRKVSNLFSNNHYELERSESLGRSWFTAIDRWRKGLIDF